MATKEANIALGCPVCRDGSCNYWFTRKTPFGRFDLNRCSKCRSAFVYPRPDRLAIESFYNDHSYRRDDNQSTEERLAQLNESEKTYPNSTLDAERMISHCKRLSRGLRFLDVGAGYGYFSHSALAQGFQVQALEPNRFERQVFGLMNHFAPHPSMLGPEFVAANKNSFDVVLLSQVLEHVRDLDESVHFFNDLLADGGVVAVAVPHFRSLVSRLQGRKDMFIIPPEHLNFFTIKGLRELFERSGFHVLMTESISRFDPRKFKRKFRFGFFSVIFSTALESVLRVADKANLGMYINIYFRKGRPALSDLSGRGRQF